MPLSNSAADNCHPLFIEVSEEGRCAFVAAYNPNSLTKKASLVIVCTYLSLVSMTDDN